MNTDILVPLLGLTAMFGGLIGIGYVCAVALRRPWIVFIASEILGTIFVGAILFYMATQSAKTPGGGDSYLGLIVAPMFALLSAAWAMSYAKHLRSTGNTK